MSFAPTINVIDAHLEYKHHLLFDQLNLEIQGGQWTCLLGASGVGKSSLLRLIAGLQTSATLNNPIQVSDGRSLQGRIAYLAQNDELLPWLTTLDNVVIGYKLRGQAVNPDDMNRARTLLERVGLQKYRDARPGALSGGMKQRALLARTLFENSQVILMDEPFAALDVITRTAIQELASELLLDRTVLLVTHDPMESLRLGHHIYVMSGQPAIISKIEISGSPPRRLTDTELLQVQAKILDKLSHSREAIVC